MSRRQDVLAGHLSAKPAQNNAVAPFPTSARAHRQLPRFDATLMERYMDPSHLLKEEVYAVFREHPELLVKELEALSKEEHRELVRRCLRALLASGQSPLTLLASDPRRYFYLGELMSLVDLSLTVKMGVQYSLWGGSVLNLGSEEHRRRYFDAIDRFDLPGCFAMTELRHGSNVAALQTEAVLDVETDEWVIHTPDDGALKWWIGNAAEDGLAATVFARLKVPAASGRRELDDHGVHAFVVPLRTAPGRLAPGVDIQDCGYKVGLNGVDNGAIRFTNVRVPRGALLDRFASVDRAGRYSSPMPSAAKRFAATLGELTGGRVGLTAGSLGVLKGGLTIAIRYSAQRQQFGPGGAAPEVAVLDYPSQQLRLLPALATAYALTFAKDALVDKYVEMKRTRDEALTADVHSLSAGLKAYTTGFTAATLSVCRECCGGHGYAAVNRLGALRSDHDIFQTFEGDNTVLLQQVAGLLLKEYRDSFRGSPLAASWSYLRAALGDALPANPLLAHDTTPRHLRDPRFLISALRHRTARMLHTVAARLRKHTRRHGAFKAWNRCLLHLLVRGLAGEGAGGDHWQGGDRGLKRGTGELPRHGSGRTRRPHATPIPPLATAQDLARAHIESVALESMYAGVQRCNDPDCRSSLKALADLFALSRIHADILFRNDDYLSPEKAKAVKRMVESLCGELRGVAVALVDAFGIPDHILRAPIGLASAQHDPYGEYLAATGWET